MGGDERTDDDWSLSWFLEPFAGSRGGLDTTPTEDFERILGMAEGRDGDERAGE
jgi:hypothetical protein